MLKIVQVPNPVLTTPSKPVPKVDGKIKKLIKQMTETLDAQIDPQGVGLAAPQVGVGLTLFIMKPTPKSPTEAFINPRIIEVKQTDKPKKKKKDSESLEGCLSIPKFWSPLHRPQEVALEYTDIEGNLQTRIFKDFDAVIVQHEVDHLEGILFTQRALEQNSQLYQEKEGELHPVTI